MQTFFRKLRPQPAGVGAFTFLLFASATMVLAQDCVRWVPRTDVGSPGARYGHSMVYDPGRGVTLMFGGEISEIGEDPDYFQDIWEYDGIHWRQVFTTGGPPSPRSWASMGVTANVAPNGSLTYRFFLGQGIGENHEITPDTWEFISTGPGTGRWQPAAVDARPRGAFAIGGIEGVDGDYVSVPAGGLPFDLLDHTAVFHEGQRKMLVLGGGQMRDGDFDDNPSELFPGPIIELWHQTNFWRREYSTNVNGGPANRFQHSTVYDSARRRVILFGGAGFADGKHWELVERGLPWQVSDWRLPYWERINLPTLPQDRALAGMVYDARRKVTVLFGGVGGARYGDTWELTPTPPVVSALSPTNAEVCAETDFVLRTTASGSGPLRGSWYIDGQHAGHFFGEFGADLELRFRDEDAGVYQVQRKVWDVCDNESVVTFHVTVHGRPRAFFPTGFFGPWRYNYCPGASHTFSVLFTSSLPATVTWYRTNGTGTHYVGGPFPYPIGEHSNTITLTNLTTSHTGDYFPIVSNSCGAIGVGGGGCFFCPPSTYSVSPVHLQIGPSILEHPASTTMSVCTSNRLFAFADGTHPAPRTPVYYQWRLDGVPITNGPYFSGATNNVLVLNPVLYMHDGNYDVIVWDDCGLQYAVTSRVAVVTVTPGPQWVYRTNSSPPPARFNHEMVYDSSRRVTVLFGGYFHSPTNFGAYNDIWEWNGSHWIQRASHSTNGWETNPINGGWRPAYADVPVGRAEHAMTYDSRRGRIVIFGGTAVDPSGVLQYLNDTWEWDGSQWYFRGTNGPGWRIASGMTFNSARNVSVLFGGQYHSGDPAPGALWEWDGTLWKTNATFGSPGSYYLTTIGMTYDSFRNNILLGPTPNFNGIVFDIFWLLNGSNWTAHGSAFNVRDDPFPNGNLVFDSYRRRATYTFGRKGEVGFWDGASWTIHTNTPAPQLRFWHGAAFDSHRRALVMFGGTFGFNQYYVNTNDTWELIYLDLPLIQQQPLSQVRQLNDIATFSVTAIGPGPLTYQWLRNGQPLANDFRISGATSNVLRIASVFRDDETLFQVRVSGACGTTVSRPVLLTLNTNLQIVHASGELMLLWNEANSVLEQADDPAGPWRSVPGATSPFNPSMAASLKFFRLRLTQ